jgi:hypothetical protein
MSSHTLLTDECLALLRDGSLRPESIAEEMACAGHTAPAPAEIAAARSLLEEMARASGEAVAQGAAIGKRIAALPEALALAVLHAAGQAGRQEILREVALGTSRPLAKEAKRELQRLKQKGVKVQELGLAGEPVVKPAPEAEAPSCYASSIDAYGERAVWFARPGRNGVEVVQAVISDVRGILAVDALGLSRKSWREFVKRMPRQSGVTSIEIPREHARALIAEAAEQGARNGFTPAAGYREALPLLGPAPRDRVAPPELDFGPDGEETAARAGAALFEDALLVAWIPEEDALRSFGLKIEEITTSQLYLDDAQRAAAVERSADEAAEAYFTPARRARYAQRLAEMARVLEAEGRAQSARTALAVSRQLSREGGPLNPFCRALFSHAWAAPSRDRVQPPSGAQAEDPGSLIVPG